MRREEKLRESMLRYLEGSLPADEVEKLNQAVEYDWAARREMAELMLQETLLTRIGEESEEFYELDAPKAAAPRRPSQRYTTSRIMKILPKPAEKTTPGIRRVVAIAAALFFAVSVVAAVKALQPDSPVLPVDPVITTAPAPEEVAPPTAPPAPPREEKPAVVTAPPPPPAKVPARAATAVKPKAPDPVKPGTEQPGTLLPADGVLTQPVPELLPPLPPSPPPTPPVKRQPAPKK
jgi:hypothetical protein